MTALAALCCLLWLPQQAVRAANDAAVPLPPSKPLTIESSARAVQPSDAVPLPLQKPDFGRPDVLQLLQFGHPPRPGHKPLRDNTAALKQDNAKIYKEIFAWQAQARWDKADGLMAQLTDMRLRGHVLYQRYMHPSAYRASFDELNGWLDLYADHPGADRIYKMAVARKPTGYAGTISKPVKNGRVGGYLEIVMDSGRDYVSPRTRSASQKKHIAALEKSIRKDIAAGKAPAAQKKLESAAAKTLDAAEHDRLAAQIAAGYLYQGKIKKAQGIAAAAAKRSGDKVPMAGWTGGLAAWRAGDYKQAAGLFEVAAASSYSSSWTKSAGAYWASRSWMRAGNMRKVNPWLEKAAAHPRTFYGLIATRALGWDFDFNWDMPELTAEHRAMLKKIPAAQRAEALIAAGQYHLAEAELRQFDPRKDKKLLEALLAFANHNELPSFAMRLAEAIPGPGGNLYDAALYPISPWNPNGGYKVDRALIHALIRQESRFDPMAESRSGAAGLMQLMPATASFVSGSRQYKDAEGRHSLKDPQVNLNIGQRYVESLLKQEPIGSELFSLITAYNAGPGNLRKWKNEMGSASDDPLLFIESVPLAETRNFVERVMSNYWIYRLRMNQPTPSLDAVAEGQWARYVRFDGGTRQASAAENGDGNGSGLN
ncbi:MAG: lytic transglycosylase domain-containing protein [Proteobacteria bacterium]|nr:lytic transglycosylase domain-containing protein [Pseudomonadota bacterium]